MVDLSRLEELARKAQWLHAACWDLADGSGCFISAESMRRFDEVFDDLGICLGSIIPLDDEDESEAFKGPSHLLARAKAAEAEMEETRERLRAAEERVAKAPVLRLSYTALDWIETEDESAVLKFIGKRVAIVEVGS